MVRNGACPGRHRAVCSFEKLTITRDTPCCTLRCSKANLYTEPVRQDVQCIRSMRRDFILRRRIKVVLVHILHNLIPVLALVRNPPPIDRKSLSVRLRPRPLHAHVSGALYALPQVIEAVVQMVTTVQSKQHVHHSLLFLRIVRLDRTEQAPSVLADLAEAVHLVEEGGGVDHAEGRFFPGWVVIVFPVGNEHEAAAVLVSF